MYSKFLFFFLLLVSLSSFSQTINTAPLDAYWKLTESLKGGDSISGEQWSRFLNLEANQIYIENQGFDSTYLASLRKNIQYVYMPQYDSIRKVRLKEIEVNPTSRWLFYKVYTYKKYEIELKKYEQQLLQPGYLDSIYKDAWQWLPARLQRKDTSVVISFLGIENDAIAGGGIIISTLWSAYNQDKIKMGILGGHEMHHVLRAGIAFENVADNDKGILYFLNSVLNEGTADMVDKPYTLAHENELPTEFQFRDFLLFQSDSILKQVDTALQQMASSKGKQYKTEKDYRKLIRYTSGHCPGYYMANIIVRNGFKNDMIANIQNPFAFIYLYNKAATKDADHPPVFSKVAVTYVKGLEEKYYKHKANSRD